MQKYKWLHVLEYVLCLVIPSLVYVYISANYTPETPDYVLMAGTFLPWLVVLFLLLRLHTDVGNRAWDTKKTRRIVICALLTGIGVVLGGLLSIPAMPLGAYTLKIGLGNLPVILAGVLFGPVYGGMVGGMTDFLQAVIFPKGAYVPFFTVIGIFFGLVPGLFFMKGQKAKLPRIIAAVFTGQVFGSVICNTLLLVWLYAMPWEIIITRLINQAVMIPLYSVLVYTCVGFLSRSKVLEGIYPSNRARGE